MQPKENKFISNRFLLGIALNLIFITVEIYYGFQANSVSLIADAVHNAADVFGLGLIWASYAMAQRKAPRHFTYGYKNATIFAAFLNAIVIFFAVGNLVWGSLVRFADPQMVVSQLMMVVASVGVVINGLTAMLFVKDRHKDINILGVYLNMAMDALVSGGVVVAGAFIWWKGWFWLDPAMGLIIAAAIVVSAWGFFKESINLIFQAVPSSVNFIALQADLSADKRIVAYHHLHIWAVSTTENALSVHIVVQAANYSPETTQNITEMFALKHNIHHSTVQLDVDTSNGLCVAEQ